MSKKRSNAEEIMAKLRQIEVLTTGGKALAQTCNEAGITAEVTYKRWRKEYGGPKAN